MGDLVLRRLDQGVAVISWNRPDKHNAINDDMSAAWREAMDWALDDPEVRCILLRGEGPSFSSGRDLTELGRRAHGESDYAFVKGYQDNALRHAESPKPIVAALRGYVLGGACEIALRADVRIAASDIQLGMPEIKAGLLPDTGGTQLLTVLAGPSRAKYLVMTGERIGADEAQRWGIVDFVVEPDELDEAALALASKLAASPPTAVAMAKQLIDGVWAEQVRRGMRQELLAQTMLFAERDRQGQRRPE